MRCLKIPRRVSIYSLLFLSLSVFTSLFFFYQNSFAADDIKITLTEFSNGGPICTSDCSSYKYLFVIPHDFFVINPQNPGTWYTYLYFNISWSNGSVSRTFPIGVYGFPNSVTFFELSSYSPDYNILNSLYYSSTWNSSILDNSIASGWSVDIILSENNPYVSGITPSGSLSITENGTYDVTEYAEVVVNIPSQSGGGDGCSVNYSEQFDGVIKAIYTCGAVLLVIYFFYCIYRLFIKTTGGY